MKTAERTGTACPLCGAPESRLLYGGCQDKRRDLPEVFDVRRCAACGVAFLSPQPSLSLLSTIYSDDYPSHIASTSRGGPLAQLMKSICLLPYRLRFGSESGAFPPVGQGRLLDIGCGIGEYLSSMSALGWTVSGCDISPSALAAARKKLPRAALHCGTMDNLPFKDGSFDTVTLWHTLEHLNNPLEALRRVHGLLAPGGRLVVAVPNIDSPEARLFGRHSSSMDVPYHLFFFSQKTLRALVEKAGFRVLRVRPQLHPSTVAESAAYLLDHLAGRKGWAPRKLLYALLYPFIAASYALGNWDCIELTAERAQ